MDITKAQSAGYNITYIAMPGETGPRVLLDLRSPFSRAARDYIQEHYGNEALTALNNQVKDYGTAEKAEIVSLVNSYPQIGQYSLSAPEVIDNLAGVTDHSLYFAYKTGGSLGFKMENDTTYTVRDIKSTECKQYCHIIGACKTLGNTPRLWIGIDGQAQLVERTSTMTTDSSTDYSSWRDLTCAWKVLFDDNVCQFSGWIFMITAVKNGAYTHYWVPMSNGKFVDVITGTTTTWAVSYRANYPL